MESRMRAIRALNEKLGTLEKKMRFLQEELIHVNVGLSENNFIEEGTADRVADVLKMLGEKHALCQKAYARLFDGRLLPKNMDTARAELGL